MTLYADLFRYPDLFLNLFRRELRVKYKGSLLGLAWTLVNPIVLMGVYTLVFSILLKAVSIHHFPLFVMSGLLTWIFFQSTIQAAPSTLLGHADLVKQVRFPRQLLPLSLVATNLVTFFAMLVVLLPVNLILIPETRTTFWVVIPLVLPLVGLVSGIAIMVACANVLFRDVEHLITTVLLPWFIATPIFYRFETLPGSSTTVARGRAPLRQLRLSDPGRDPRSALLRTHAPLAGRRLFVLRSGRGARSRGFRLPPRRRSTGCRVVGAA